MADNPSIPIETFGAIAAELDAAVDGADVLARRGMSREVWASAQIEWTMRFREQARSHQGSHVEAFIAAYRGATTEPNLVAADTRAWPSPSAAKLQIVLPAPTPLAASPADPRPATPPAEHRSAAALPSFMVAAARVPEPARAVAPPNDALVSRATVMADPSVPAHGALPFAGRAHPLSAVTPAPSIANRPSPADPDRGFTAAPGAIDLNALPFGASKPSASPVKIDLSMMPLDRYAELTVALASGEPREAVLRRFFLTEEVWLALARAWGEQLASNPERKAQFDAHIRRLRGAP